MFVSLFLFDTSLFIFFDSNWQNKGLVSELIFFLTKFFLGLSGWQQTIFIQAQWSVGLYHCKQKVYGTNTAFTSSKSRYRVHLVISMMTKD